MTRHPEKTVYPVYQLLLIVLVYPAIVLLLLYVLITGNHRKGIRQRLTLYQPLDRKTERKRIWIHAASIGEVQAASLLIEELRKVEDNPEIVLTTMTIHGREFASSSTEGVTVLLAPLDLPALVGRAVRRIDPDIYVCLETELWPLLLRGLKRSGVPVIMVNGRMSSRTVSTYTRYNWFFRQVLANFTRLCLISKTDKERFIGAGVDEDRLEVTGNIKFDKYLPDDREAIRENYRDILDLKEGQEVLVAGSTHEDEEEQISRVFPEIAQDRDTLLLVAPRHLDRIDSISSMFARYGYQVDLFSVLKGGAARRRRIVLIDTFGDLMGLYSIATYVFCGGSLVDRRGHNIMEPALWGKPVFYGPSMDDFRDGVELLGSTGAGFTVKSGNEITALISRFRQRPEEYAKACRKAEETAGAQQGAAQRQGEVVRFYLNRR